MSLLRFQSEHLPGDLRPDGDKAREKVFLEHYRGLLNCALQFTHGQRERAEDLVHDAFVQFQIKRVDIGAVEDVRSYLNGILRNLFLLQVRRAARHPVQQFSLLDHDSADMSLRAQNPLDQFQSADMLIRACKFVCHRKETSIPASILILRFFHGYYTDEICRITGTQRRQVNKWLLRGKNETKSFLENPQPLPGPEPDRKPTQPDRPSVFLSHLRGMIFDSCKTPCSILDEATESNAPHALAHLVSCRQCLERRSRRLGLPSAAERMMDDISSGGDGAAGGTGDSGPTLHSSRRSSQANRIRRSYRNRLREIFEHHPTELSIAFDGDTHATLLLNASLNTLNLSLEQKQCPDSVAILSEQEVCLLILDRKEIESAERKVYSVSLSEGRSLEVIVTPEFRGPSLHIAYHNPELISMPVNAQNHAVGDMEEELSLIVLAGAASAPERRIRRWWRQTLGAFPWLEKPTMNPTLATALVLAVVASLLLVVGLHQQSQKKMATNILQRASAIDSSFRAAAEPGVIVQEVRIRATGVNLKRTIYRDAQLKRHARQLDPDTSKTLARKLASVGVNWDLPLSPASYSDWHDHGATKRDTVTHPEAGLVTLTTTVAGDSPVAKESLTLRESDLHAVARTIDFRDSGTVEIAELDYSVLPWGPKTDSLFEPLGGEALGLPQGSYTTPALHLPQMLSEDEFADAELAARLVLHQLGADANERIEIARGVNSVQVKGIVASQQRKREIEWRLHSVPNVVSAIYTFEEFQNRSTGATAITSLKQSTLVATQSPLEIFLAGKGASKEVIRETGLKLSNCSVIVDRESRAIADLLVRFPRQDVLTENARSALSALLSDHRSELAAALQEEGRLLAAAGFQTVTPAASQTGSLTTTAHRNSVLMVELLSGSAEPPRPASLIVPELEATIAELRAVVVQVSNSVSAPQSSSISPSAVTNQR